MDNSNVLEAEKLTKAIEEIVSKKQTAHAMTGKDVKVERVDGGPIKLPKNMSYDEGIQWLKRRKENDEQLVAVNGTINGFAADGLAAFHRVLSRLYGWTQAVPEQSFFGERPPQMVTLDLDAEGKKLTLPFGQIQIPGIEGNIHLNLNRGGTFSINAQVKGKHLDAINTIIELTKESAAKESLYKGQAVKTALNGATAPLFINLKQVNKEDLILPLDVEAAVTTSLFTPISKAENCRKWGIPLKRGILLSGKFGTGKSFTAMVTALLAKKHGWTFIYLQDIEQLATAVEMARHYAPAVLFAEDLDRVVNGERDIDMDNILNTLDGIDGKGTEVIAVFTTNDVNAINPAMLRPGRLDAVIDVKAPDAEAAMRLLKNYSRGLADADCNFAESANLVAGMVPAAIREVVERAKLAAIGNGHDLIQGEDLTAAAHAMKNQTQLFEREQPVGKNQVLVDAFENLVKATEVAKLTAEGHAGDLGRSNCGNPNCPIHGKLNS
jgi:transitional endoplasmic reticulum ATPase